MYISSNVDFDTLFSKSDKSLKICDKLLILNNVIFFMILLLISFNIIANE